MQENVLETKFDTPTLCRHLK
uniref:Uncharacterized protein n=1 Tax=Arundo donax TaxID=35708 RepID=A0A0A9A1S3_ARUDO